VTSKDVVNEPFLQMLVELEWPTGRVVREFTILLDPPTYIPPPPSDAVMGPSGQTAAPAAPAVPSAEPAEPSAAPAAMTSGVEYEVAKGDTLAKIAREHMIAGVTLNQMMIALYRANSDAFIRDNINLVRAGRILNVPDRDTVAAVDSGEATEVVLSHMASFGEYRRKIAAAAPTTSATSGQQAVEGRITAPDATAKPESSGDQLKLSRAGKPGPDASGGPATTTSAASEDDRVARERALDEAQSRVKELEKNVTDLQKLLEIKSQQVAELEKQAEAAQTASVAPVAKPAVEAPKPVAVAPKPAVEAPKPAPASAKPKPVVKPKPAAMPKPMPAPEPSLVDEYLGDPLMLGGLGAVILLLAGYGAYAWKKKKRTAQSQFQDGLLGAAAGGASAVGAAEAAGAEAAPAGAAEEVDPLAEADVYMAYGRDVQAEEILREALSKDASRPGVHAKLLEIYAKRRDAKQFEATALKMKGLVGGEGPEWDKAMALGRSIDPGNGLYGQGEAAAEIAPESGVTEAPAVDFNLDATTGLDRSPQRAEPEASAAPTLDFDLGGTTTEEPVAAEADSTAPEPSGLDFDLGGMTTEQPAPAEAAPVAEAAAPDTAGGLDFELNLDMDVPAEEAAPAAGGTDLSTISLDLGGTESAGTSAGGGDAKWQEVATKLDLAKAYEEMGDKDGARELLNEVAKEGDAEQQAQAQQMLASLG
jgi:pilus assembly protein FimV